jgi:hypothetical protein
MNKGLSDSLKAAFPPNEVWGVTPVVRPAGLNPVEIEIIDSNWLAGFVDGEGCFNVKNKEVNKKRYVQLRFVLTQHYRDTYLMQNIAKKLGTGLISVDTTLRSAVYLTISKLSDIIEIVIPLFKEFPLYRRRKKSRLKIFL